MTKSKQKKIKILKPIFEIFSIFPSPQPQYKCQYCERAFAQSNDLVKHTRSHVGMNTYKCDQCPVAFRLHGELRNHRQQHFLESKGMLAGDQSSQESFDRKETVVDSVTNDDRYEMLQLETSSSSQPQIFVVEKHLPQQQTIVAHFMTQS